MTFFFFLLFFSLDSRDPFFRCHFIDSIKIKESRKELKRATHSIDFIPLFLDLLSKRFLSDFVSFFEFCRLFVVRRVSLFGPFLPLSSPLFALLSLLLLAFLLSLKQAADYDYIFTHHLRHGKSFCFLWTQNEIESSILSCLFQRLSSALLFQLMTSLMSRDHTCYSPLPLSPFSFFFTDFSCDFFLKRCFFLPSFSSFSVFVKRNH